MKYPKHVMDKINSDKELKKRYEKQTKKLEAAAAKKEEKDGKPAGK